MKKLLLLLTLGIFTFGLNSCKDECEDVACVNGTCSDGGCICEDGWTGNDCSICTNEVNGTEKTVNCNISSNTNWSNDTVYILASRIYVEDGATLTIEEGTIIKGQTGTETNSKALIVSRGGRLMAEGTPTAPIIFTSVNDNIAPSDITAGNFGSPNLSATQNGLWGGLIILGKAEISGSASELQIEGIPSSENALYGGSNNSDNSGTISYVSIRHGGSDIGAGNEINGLTLGGVGSGTSISNVEIVANQDDGIEWFGGRVDVSNVVVWNAGDDALDTDQGWSGTCSNFIIVTPSGSCFELDGPEGTPLTTGNHRFTDGTIYAGNNGAFLVDCDDDTNVDMDNLYFFGIENGDTATASIADVAAAGGVFGSWEYTMDAAFNVTEVFYEVPSSAITSVAQNGNTVGATSSSTSGFEWTWAAQSGGLSGIGL